MTQLKNKHKRLMLLNKLCKINYTVFHGQTVSGGVINTEPDRVLRSFYPYELGTGVFLEIGAGRPIFISNSYHFRCNGWKIISIEANPIYCQEFRDMNFDIIECAVSDRESKNNIFSIHYLSGHMLSASGLGNGKVGIYPDHDVDFINVETKTLDQILQIHHTMLDKIDILSMDIEGGEVNALKGFNINKYNPTICCIEDNCDP